MTETPEAVLARARRDAEALRRRGFGEAADRDEQLIAELARALEPLALVSESHARLRSGKGVRWLRERHAAWVRASAAGYDAEGNRTYRLCVLPSRLARDEGAAMADQILRAS